MIRTFRHKGLEAFFHTGSCKGIRPEHAGRLWLILGRLNSAMALRDMNLPGLGLHPLKGKAKDFRAVAVSGNWRIIFRFSGTDAFDVDYFDYH